MAIAPRPVQQPGALASGGANLRPATSSSVESVLTHHDIVTKSQRLKPRVMPSGLQGQLCQTRQTPQLQQLCLHN
jgi:hypothetical protein